jgi:hypothetical protein
MVNTLHWKLIEANVQIDDKQFSPPMIKKPAA